MELIYVKVIGEEKFSEWLGGQKGYLFKEEERKNFF